MNVNSFLQYLPQKIRVYLKFIYRNKYFPNFYEPKTFNEKITYRKLNDKNELFVICADKFKVRDYVRDKVGEKYLIPLLKCVADISKNDFEMTEVPFIVKCNHNSGNVVIFDSVAKLNDSFINDAVDKFSSELKKDYGRLYDENWYSRISPLVIFERLLQKIDGTLPEDFKFHIFRSGLGHKIIIQVDFDRFSSHNRTFYTTDLKVLPYINKYPNKFRKFPEVDNFNEMLQLAIKLSEDFTYSRVDLYNVDGRVYFGELTFCHGSGLDFFQNKSQDLEWGDFWVEQ
jgi:hypothetical protein